MEGQEGKKWLLEGARSLVKEALEECSEWVSDGEEAEENMIINWEYEQEGVVEGGQAV